MSARPPRVWTVPVLLGLMSGVGLVAALVGDGAWKALSSLCLGTPVAVVARCCRRTDTPGGTTVRRH